MHFQIQTLPPPQFELRYLFHDTQEVTTQEGNGGSTYFALLWRLTCTAHYGRPIRDTSSCGY